MLFRRPVVAEPSFEQRLETLRGLGCAVEQRPDGTAWVVRDGCAAIIQPGRIVRRGALIDGEIAALVDAGFQKFWRTPGGANAPALARWLKALHNLEEDLREALGLESRYNTSLGTTNDRHEYDRCREKRLR